MIKPSHADAFEVLCLQAADEGRGPILFGDCVERVRSELRPFMCSVEFPSVYLEYPLTGDPFLDVTVLYGALQPGTRIQSAAAAGTESMLDWYAPTHDEHNIICVGFELDTKYPTLQPAAVHFQPRMHTELVMPFCETIGEEERGSLYLELGARMPKGWPLSFFGMFRGRADSPLRVCGYLDDDEKQALAASAAHLKTVFDSIGFTAYDDSMLGRITELASAAPGTIDFQFDIYPDGHLGNTFALDVQFAIKQPEAVRESFANGPAARVMHLLENWGATDERWKLTPDAAFARAIPIVLDDGSKDSYAFTLMPQWAKVRWRNTQLQPSKMYLLASAGIIEKPT